MAYFHASIAPIAVGAGFGSNLIPLGFFVQGKSGTGVPPLGGGGGVPTGISMELQGKSFSVGGSSTGIGVATGARDPLGRIVFNSPPDPEGFGAGGGLVTGGGPVG